MYLSHVDLLTGLVNVVKSIDNMEGRKEMFYLMTHSTHFIYGYMDGTRHMVKDHSDSERGNTLLPHGLLFLISSNDSFMCTIPQTG